jgi:hypothetical protein
MAYPDRAHEQIVRVAPFISVNRIIEWPRRQHQLPRGRDTERPNLPMCDDRIEEKIKDQGIIQRGILLELLRSDHPGRWKRVELRGRLYDATRSAFEKALTRSWRPKTSSP